MHLIPNAPVCLSGLKRHPPHGAHLCILLDLLWVSDGAKGKVPCTPSMLMLVLMLAFSPTNLCHRL